jgi:hypothetical protein
MTTPCACEVLQSEKGVLYEEETGMRRGGDKAIRRGGEDLGVVDDDERGTLLKRLKSKLVAIEMLAMKRKEHATCWQIACICTD